MMLQFKQSNQARLITLLSVLTALYSGFTRADAEPPNMTMDLPTSTQTASSPSSSSVTLKKETFRIRNFTEFMTPAVNNHSNSVPDMTGTPLMPTNAFNIFWTDYEIAKDWKLVYWQRAQIYFAETRTATAPDATLRNPRFGIRKVNVFKVPNLQTTYDFFLQPGLATEGRSDIKGRSYEFAIRTNTSYNFPGTRWNTGLITEMTVSMASEMTEAASKNANFYGWAMPWLSYDLSSHVSTQHYATVNFQQLRNSSRLLHWDDPMPYIQNGVGFDLNSSIWAAAFINNYLGTAPTLANTWASVWLTLKVL